MDKSDARDVDAATLGKGGAARERGKTGGGWLRKVDVGEQEDSAWTLDSVVYRPSQRRLSPVPASFIARPIEGANRCQPSQCSQILIHEHSYDL